MGFCWILLDDSWQWDSMGSNRVGFFTRLATLADLRQDSLRGFGMEPFLSINNTHDGSLTINKNPSFGSAYIYIYHTDPDPSWE